MTRNIIKISPSILSADFAKLGEEVESLSKAGATYIHVDVMDGHFTPNITIGPQVINHIKKHSAVPLDVHLMIENVEQQLDNFIKAGSDIITFHYESTNDPLSLIKHIKSKGVRAGISIIPSTPASKIESIIPELDYILVMTVVPGYAGQEFMGSQVDKISQIRSFIEKSGKEIDLAVDGGIDNNTAKICVNAGANVLVSGSYIFKDNKNYKERIDELLNTSISGSR